MKKALFIAALGCGLIAAQPGHAVVITGTNDDFTIDWSLGAGQPDNDGGPTSSIDLSATGVFDVVAFSGSSFKLNITITNTTVLSGAITEAAILSFGFGTDPNATGVSFADDSDGGFVNALLQTTSPPDPQQTFPGGFKYIDICVFTDGCNGGDVKTGLAPGAIDGFMVTVFGDFSGGGVTLEPFPIKFQTTLGSYAFAGRQKVPEPGSLAVMGLGLAMLGFLYRRRPAPARRAA